METTSLTTNKNKLITFPVILGYLFVFSHFSLLAQNEFKTPTNQGTNSFTGGEELLPTQEEREGISNRWGESRYKINNDEVTDLDTKYVWKVCSEGQVWENNACSGDAKEFDGKEAMAVNKNNNSTWRVPTIEELSSLVALNKFNPAINIDIFKNTKTKLYWSSTPYGKDKDTLWTVYFGSGLIANATWYNKGYLRLIKKTE